ncbi:dolichyl-p-man:man c-pp-dolichyl mannosyltransferase [Stylonychia lemnae]|uniref:dolichyl-P-Man:Man5GlcNAc2-PP-dolichol alpha-1,3-mannosyltransferase n=1 Tax=Stylonychia lemnae TaxID=5949 RepID=A0A078A957_STYLE|nr:dolichyl-p-man:man c-pp-dolichyl mannosyltransferase [Stylonychia lemnae]|eukprot:CDW78102.1 dolichyl-p-man:man c-pp-dolichyl mannosyltransferase [Stylonychia lemnae]
MQKILARNITSVAMALDAIIGLAVLFFVPYTEIDWVAYMQQVETFLDGERTYTNLVVIKHLNLAYLQGQTGPCVYPAGHIYIFSLLYALTDNGKNVFVIPYIHLMIIQRAQLLFYCLYLFQLYALISIYKLAFKDRELTYKEIITILFLVLSRRIHSIFILRCFNDCISMTFMYLAVYYLQRSQTVPSILFFSLGLSVKMNVLLFLPALLMNLNFHFGLLNTFKNLLYVILFQIFIGYPFIAHNASAYFGRAFEFSRVFTFKWSVNCVNFILTMQHKACSLATILEQYVLEVYTSNFTAGIFINSPLYYTLLKDCPLRLVCWNIFPARSISSFVLFIVHVVILSGQLLFGKRWESPYQIAPIRVKNPIKFD